MLIFLQKKSDLIFLTNESMWLRQDDQKLKNQIQQYLTVAAGELSIYTKTYEAQMEVSQICSGLALQTTVIITKHTRIPMADVNTQTHTGQKN